MLGKELISVVNAEIEEAQKEAAKRVLKCATDRMIDAANKSTKAVDEYNRLIGLSVVELAEMDRFANGGIVSYNNITIGPCVLNY